MARIVSILLLVLPTVLSAFIGDLEIAKKGGGDIWAVLVAGSKGFDNYRHQADVCHAYQILHRHGIPDERIIVMMYDDVAKDEKNPYIGQIFNKFGGPDVYGPKKVPKDYISDAVTPENFIKVLTGDAEGLQGVGSGKVLKSGPNDHVFINFVDHGGSGVVAFPGSYMLADTLIKALQKMHEKKMYKKLLFYLESCESGSMFDGFLPSNISVIATTATNTEEMSFACYCFDKPFETCLGDAYSVAWMEDIDSEEGLKNQTTESIKKQYNNVVTHVAKYSHAMMYGDMKLSSNLVKDFLGELNDTSEFKSATRTPVMGTVSSREVSLYLLEKKIASTTDLQTLKMLKQQRTDLVQGRQAIDQLLTDILERVPGLSAAEVKNMEKTRPKLTMEMMPCYRKLVDSFVQTCVDINKNNYALGQLYKLANLCILEPSLSTDDVLKVYSETCTEAHRNLLGVN